MGKVYFVRHGQTYWNVENKICGATDIALTPLGHEQAIETGKAILDAGIDFDEILSSPLIRASETARHISEITGKPMRIDERLTEQNFGKYESTARDGAEFALAKEHFADRYEGGESMLHLAQRIYNLLDELKADPEGKTYLLVAHNGIARVKRDKTSLDIFWIKDKSLADLDNLPDPDVLASDIIDNLQSALDSFNELKAQLEK